MSTQPKVRTFSGANQTAASAGSTAATVVLSDWSAADGWVATVEALIVAVGVSTEKCDLYYRHEVFKWTDGAGAPAAVGALVAPTVLEEDAAWDAIVARNGNNIEVQMAGEAAEKVNFVWFGTISFQRVG